MKHLNQQAKRIMDKLTAPLNGVGSATKFDAHDYATKQGGIMAVSVECVNEIKSGKVYSVTHYYEQNGDLMSDPDMTFVKAIDGNYYPLSYQQDNLGIYQEVVAEYDEAGNILKYKPRLQADLVIFANQWMRNIKDQQNL